MSRRHDLICILLILAVALAMHGHGVLRGRVLLPADSILLMRPWGLHAAKRFPEFRFTQNQMLGPIFEYYSWRFQARERIRNGQVPLWNPLELGGNVLLANSQSAVLYPPNVLLYVLPLWLGINLLTLFHSAATGLLMFGFLRSVRLGPWAALTGSLAWMLCGPMLVWSEFQTPTAALCWLPGALWSWEHACRRRRMGMGVVTTALFLALSLTAGHPQFAFYVVLAGGMYMLWRSARSAWWALPASLAAALLLGASTLLPLAEAVRINHRATRESYTEAMALRLPPEYLLTLAAPNVLGNPRDYVRIQDGQALPGNPYVGKYDFIEYCHYAGIGVLILALTAVLRGFASGVVRYFVLLGLLAVALGLGTPVGAVFYYLVPGYSQFHAPARALALLAFALCGLAAFGVELLTAPAQNGQDRRSVSYGGPRRRTSPAAASRMALSAEVRVTLGAAAACGLLAVAAWPLLSLTHAEIRGEGWLAYEAAGIRHAVLIAAAVGVLAWLASATGPERRRAFAAVALPLVCAADLLVWGAGFNPATDPDMLGGPTAVGDALAHAWPARVLSLEAPGKGIKSLIVPNYNAVVGFREVQGADSVHSRRYHVAMEQVARAMVPAERPFPDANTIRLPGAEHPLLDALNVEYVTTCPPETLSEDRFERVADLELTLWRNQRACGPAWFVSEALQVSGPEDAVRAMARPGFDVRRTAVLEATPPAMDAGAEAVVRNVRVAAHSWSCEMEATGRGLLVVSEAAYPGWRATVRHSGASMRVPILVADGVLRAVPVPSGKSTVTLSYEPSSFLVGLYLTCAGVFALCGLAVRAMMLRARRSP